MTAFANRQWRPISNVEAYPEDGLSVSAIRDLYDAMNNYKCHVLPDKILSYIWQYGSGPQSADNSTSETVIIPPMACREIPRSYSRVMWRLGHLRKAGSGTTAWKFYLNAKLYQGPETPFDSTYLYLQQSSTITTTDITARIDYEHTILHLMRGGNTNLVWPVLTATNSDTGTRSEMYLLEAWGVP